MTLERAITLRGNGDVQRSRALLEEMQEITPEDGRVSFHLALTCIAGSDETTAIRLLARAVELGLPASEEIEAVLAWTACLRTRKRYFEAARVLRSALERHPDEAVLQAFLALTMHTMGMHGEAAQMMVNVVVQTSGNRRVQDFATALRHYADQL